MPTITRTKAEMHTIERTFTHNLFFGKNASFSSRGETHITVISSPVKNSTAIVPISEQSTNKMAVITLYINAHHIRFNTNLFFFFKSLQTSGKRMIFFYFSCRADLP